MQERIDALRLPKSTRGDIDDLVRALNAASDKEAIEREAQMQIAFIVSQEKAKKLRSADIEALYIIFDDAVQAKLEELDCTHIGLMSAD
ncbi:hypothetical protein [Pseudomonas sp. UBA1879]|uniref:hypothetical protein n=1 Tax=Pseudomonas sp. UBA1879 TaxID=1947305 RepID=UPI0025E92758|nr:hypothetical protein [Pseudomonas sp. UBA1879]